MANAAQIASYVMQVEGGTQFIPADSGSGWLGQPLAVGQPGGRLTSFETLNDFYLDQVLDPDEALAKDPDILSKITNQADVMACMEKRAKSVCCLPIKWDANPLAPNEALAKECALWASRCWDQIQEVRNFYYQCQYGIIPGGVGFEVMWQQGADGAEVPYQIFPFHKTRLLADRLGNWALLTRWSPAFGTYLGANSTSPQLVSSFPLGKILYYTYRREPGTWLKPALEGYMYFGKGLDVELYYVVTFDQFVQRFQMKWLEKFGMPPMFLYYPDTATSNDISAMNQVLKSMRGESVIRVPRPVGIGREYDRFKIETPPVPSPSFDAYNQFYLIRTKPAIEALMLGSSDEQSNKESGGGYSGHQSRRDSGPMVFYKHDARLIDDVVNSQLVPAMMKRGPKKFRNLTPDYYPKHHLVVEEERDRLQESAIIETVSKFVPLVEEEVYDRVGFRRPQPGDKTVGGAMMTMEEDDPFGGGDDDGGDDVKPTGGRNAIGQSNTVKGSKKQAVRVGGDDDE